MSRAKEKYRRITPVTEDGKALGLMPNYNEISGIPTHANKWMLTDVLRSEWEFKGMVLSDYTATNELKNVHHIAADSIEAGAKALNAGGHGIDRQFHVQWCSGSH